MSPHETRRRILETAIGLFAAKGYAGTSIRDIADQLGLTTAALYYHFESKEALLEATADRFLSQLEALIEQHPPSPDLDAKRSLLHGYLEAIAESPDLSRVMAYDPAISVETAIGRRLSAAVDALIERLAAPSQSREAKMRAVAALGAVRRPLLQQGVEVPDPAVLVFAAMSVLAEG